MIPLLRVMLAALFAAQAAPADPLIAENAVAKVSEHVYVISDRNVDLVPNVGIIARPAYTETP